MSEKNAKAVLSALAVYMERNPELRVLQALSNLIDPADLFYMTDGELATILWSACKPGQPESFVINEPIGRM